MASKKPSATHQARRLSALPSPRRRRPWGPSATEARDRVRAAAATSRMLEADTPSRREPSRALVSFRTRMSSAFWYRECSEQNRIHSTEHGGGGAYAQSERKDPHRGETRRFAQAADGVAHVLPNSLHGRFPPEVPRLFLDGVHAADLDTRSANSFLAAHPGRHFLFGDYLQVGAQLLVHVPFHPCLVEQTPEPADDAPEQQNHNSPSEARRILVIAAVCASQSRVARLSVARPSGVML